MAYTTHRTELDTRSGLRAGLVGLVGMAVLAAATAVLAWTVVDHDSPAAPAQADYPIMDEMDDERLVIEQKIDAHVAGAMATPEQVLTATGPKQHRPSGPDLLTANEMTEQERQAAAIAPALVPLYR